MEAAYVTAGVGLVLLVALLLIVFSRVRRFSRAVALLRAEIDRETKALPALRRLPGRGEPAADPARTPGDEIDGALLRPGPPDRAA